MHFEGKRYLQIKLLSLFTVEDAKGKEIDEGEFLRCLSEAPWLSTDLLPNQYFHWK
ncbi:MAG: hypothetical protein H0U27_12105 [Nitrosopumilus sp.]|nr:hypothetical protein [Nitrosopumilus sp.]